MPRGPRLDAPDSLHHVIIRGIEKRKIFENDEDRQDFLRRLGHVVIEERMACLAWSLLPNHAHLLLRRSSVPLARMMRRLLTGYAVSFNLRHQRSGHLFQNRYKSILCEEDAYLLELVRYIHLNCIRAGLVTDLEALDFYPWSGHSALMGNMPRVWQATGEVLRCFSPKKQLGRSKYRQFIADGMSQGRRDELTGWRSRGREKEGKEGPERQSDQRILGNPYFVETILKKEAEMLREQTLSKKKGIGVEVLLNRVLEKIGVTREEIIGGGRRHHISLARSVFCHLASKYLGMTGRDLSRTLRLTPATIHYAVIRGERILNENGRMKEDLISIFN